MVFRVYVEKRQGFDIEAKKLEHELRNILGIGNLLSLRLLNCYDVEDITEELFCQCIPTVFSEPQSDIVYKELEEVLQVQTEDGAATQAQSQTKTGTQAQANVQSSTQVQAQAQSNPQPPTTIFAVEALPGQFDQRADSASECIQLISQKSRPLVKNTRIYCLEGELTPKDIAEIKNYVINPVESREAPLDKPETLKVNYPQPKPVEVIEGFLDLTHEELQQFINNRGLAMDLADISFCQQYFSQEKRNPTISEIKMIDTYWSDHCRHTTFGTELTNIKIDDEIVQKAFDRYLQMREELHRTNKPVCLMDIGTIGAKYLKAKGSLTGLDESEEINACTVKIKCDVNGHDEDWLFLFKNETHNHPTEIEPFGGAATCIGGAIRDPLSGRSYVYQAMRVTGAGDPLTPISQTLPGKLPQRKIVTTAAAGYSSYGNQIGLATGQVSELYHPNYVAKRMEVGAVVGATPADHVRRETPAPGDKIVLLGGRTGRDGIGGATGSSKEHKRESLDTCGAEVQKGNAPVERKLQRLFRRGDACRLIKRCNDFGAGGVSVACGELADGMIIDLNAVPKKYDGLDGTELAISESQERMACAIAATDVDEFMGYAREENIEASVVATITEKSRVKVMWNDEAIIDLSREFLNSNGAPKQQDVHVCAAKSYRSPWHERLSTGLSANLSSHLRQIVTDINFCSNKGLAECFDSTIGAKTVLMPFGGKRQLTAPMAMVSKLPVFGDTTTISGMSWGYNPYIMEKDQYRGAYLSVVESVAKLIATGFERSKMYLSFQEYFESLRVDPERWGKPTAALLGALMAQVDLEVGAIGGKDSMSGSFEDLDVPPTLISFAVATGKVERVISPEFKRVGSKVVFIRPQYQENGLLPQKESLLAAMDYVEKLVENNAVLAISTPGDGCGAESIFKMALGNAIGLEIDGEFYIESLLEPAYGSFIVELAEGSDVEVEAEDVIDADAANDTDAANATNPTDTRSFTVEKLGQTTSDYTLKTLFETIDLTELQEAWERPLEDVFPYRGASDEKVPIITYDSALPLVYNKTIAKPRVVIPVFPGNNCEYDSAMAFERAGAEVSIFVINNLTPKAVAESTQELARQINNSQIVMIPGGFSGGDEPDGSAKFITSFFRAPEITEAVRKLLNERDGLMLGICNGFQALIKLGLVPFGDICDMNQNCPTLTFNTIGRHISKMVRTRVASNLSPWMIKSKPGDIHMMPISHGEGRFVAPQSVIDDLISAGQIATQYVDENGHPSMDLDINPNGSLLAIEGITSPDGRILGKMGHTERSGAGLYFNIPGSYEMIQPLFESGVCYFSE